MLCVSIDRQCKHKLSLAMLSFFVDQACQRLSSRNSNETGKIAEPGNSDNDSAITLIIAVQHCRCKYPCRSVLLSGYFYLPIEANMVDAKVSEWRLLLSALLAGLVFSSPFPSVPLSRYFRDSLFTGEWVLRRGICVASLYRAVSHCLFHQRHLPI